MHLIEQRGTILTSAATEQQRVDVLARPCLARPIASATLEWLAARLARAETVAITARLAACRDHTADSSSNWR